MNLLAGEGKKQKEKDGGKTVKQLYRSRVGERKFPSGYVGRRGTIKKRKGKKNDVKG